MKAGGNISFGPRQDVYRTVEPEKEFVMAILFRPFGLFIFFMVSLVQGCATPSLNIAVKASETINTDVAGESYAVLVRFYQLSDPSVFEKAEVSALLRSDEAILSATLLEKRELMVSPGLQSSFELPKIDSTKYLGVVAFFRDAEGGDQLVYRKVNTGKLPFSTQLLLQVKGKNISLTYR